MRCDERPTPILAKSLKADVHSTALPAAELARAADLCDCVGMPTSMAEENCQKPPRAFPDIWPSMQTKQAFKEETMDDNAFSAEALRFRIGDRVNVTLSEGPVRKAEVRFNGRIEDIAPGYFIGVVYDEPVGKNDGSVFGRRYFECKQGKGGFVRPNLVSQDFEYKAPEADPMVKLAAEAEARKLVRKGKKGDVASPEGESAQDASKAEDLRHEAKGANKKGDSSAPRWAEKALAIRRLAVREEAKARGLDVEAVLEAWDRRNAARVNVRALSADPLDSDKLIAAANYCTVSGDGLRTSIVRRGQQAVHGWR